MKIKSWYQVWSDRLGDFYESAHFDQPHDGYFNELVSQARENVDNNLNLAKATVESFGMDWSEEVEKIKELKASGVDGICWSFWEDFLALPDMRWVKVSQIIEGFPMMRTRDLIRAASSRSSAPAR